MFVISGNNPCIEHIGGRDQFTTSVRIIAYSPWRGTICTTTLKYEVGKTEQFVDFGQVGTCVVAVNHILKTEQENLSIG